MTPQVLYVLGVRVYSGEHYRTRYYRECIDGVPRFGERQDAPFFEKVEVERIVAQLLQLRPREIFFVLESGQRPPRGKGEHLPPSPKPTQSDAFSEVLP